jgi:hypothetical protein
MVNAGFPARRAYGFERVDAGRVANAAVNRKFTPNQISGIVCEFPSN